MVPLGKIVRRRMIICIGGLAGSGKSTVANKLAEKYGLKYLSGGDALRALAREMGYKTVDCGWWESDVGLRFLEERGRNHKFDRAVDKRLLKMAQSGNVVLDSWTMPWLLKGGFKIWLEASPRKRAERIAGRDKISVKEALSVLKRKEGRTKAIYRKLYGFRLGEDFAPFNLVLDTDNLESDEVLQILCMVIDNVVLGCQNG
jgi:cytidylate kinase